MTNTLIRVFDRMEDATEARERLLELGLPESNVELTATGDEAGAVQGNFAVDGLQNIDRKLPFLGEPDRGAHQEAHEAVSQHSDFSGRQDVVYRANFILSVEAYSLDQQREVELILDRMGAIDVEARAQRGQ